MQPGSGRRGSTVRGASPAWAWLARRLHALGEDPCRGAASVEYAVMITFVAAVIVAAVVALGAQLPGAFCSVFGAVGGSC